MSDNLKPCPHCGGPAYLHYDPYEQTYLAECQNPKCRGDFHDKQEAIDAWNSRQELQQACYMANRLAYMLKEVEFRGSGEAEIFGYCPICGYDEHSWACDLKEVLGEYDKIKEALKRGENE